MQWQWLRTIGHVHFNEHQSWNVVLQNSLLFISLFNTALTTIFNSLTSLPLWHWSTSLAPLYFCVSPISALDSYPESTGSHTSTSINRMKKAWNKSNISFAEPSFPSFALRKWKKARSYEKITFFKRWHIHQSLCTSPAVLLSLKQAQAHTVHYSLLFQQQHPIPLLISTSGRVKISKSMVPPFAEPSERSKRTTLSAAPCMSKKNADQW